MKKVVLVTVLAFASAALAVAPYAMAQDQSSSSGQITIKDPAEYNDYTNAIGQTDPGTRAAAIETFLQKYPQSVVKPAMLETLMGTYQQMGDINKTTDAATRVLAGSPNNLRALAFLVYVKRSQAFTKTNPQDAQPILDEAAALAQRGLNAPKPAEVPQADFDKFKSVVSPIFHSAIGWDNFAKKDFKGAIASFRNELQGMPLDQTKTGQGLVDTYQLGLSYIQEEPKDLVNGFWFMARAANFMPAAQKENVEKAAQYWYKKYHGDIEGYEAVKAKAAEAIFPPEGFSVTPAPPPPSPQELAHQAITGTADLKTLALGDKEFILSNGNKEDAEKVWAVMKDVTAEVPGKVVEATADQVKLAVTEDAKSSNTADFTINMKTPLKDVPAPGTEIKVIATFDSYTQNPGMIILKDGEPAPEKKAAPKTGARKPAARKGR